MATNGSWIPRRINGEAVISKPFILTLIYDLESGCTNGEVTVDSVNRDYEPISNMFEIALSYFLNFENNVGGSNQQLECAILQPLELISID